MRNNKALGRLDRGWLRGAIPTELRRRRTVRARNKSNDRGKTWRCCNGPTAAPPPAVLTAVSTHLYVELARHTLKYGRKKTTQLVAHCKRRILLELFQFS
jgi:hypothetical protein